MQSCYHISSCYCLVHKTHLPILSAVQPLDNSYLQQHPNQFYHHLLFLICNVQPMHVQKQSLYLLRKLESLLQSILVLGKLHHLLWLNYSPLQQKRIIVLQVLAYNHNVLAGHVLYHHQYSLQSQSFLVHD